VEKLTEGGFQRLRSGVSASHVAESLQLRHAYKPEALTKGTATRFHIVAQGRAAHPGLESQKQMNPERVLQPLYNPFRVVVRLELRTQGGASSPRRLR